MTYWLLTPHKYLPFLSTLNKFFCTQCDEMWMGSCFAQRIERRSDILPKTENGWSTSIVLGAISYYPGLQATGLYDDLVLKTLILGDALEVGQWLVAKALECIEGPNDASVNDWEYCDYDGDWWPGWERKFYKWNLSGHIFDTCTSSVVLCWPHNLHIDGTLSFGCSLTYL